MSWINQILTGRNNQTIAIGRALGILLMLVFLIILPSLAVIMITLGWMGPDAWQMIFRELTTYVPAIVLSVSGLIGLTAFSEPRERPHDDGGNANG